MPSVRASATTFVLPAIDRLLAALVAELPVSQAASLAAKLTGASRNLAYQLALALNKKE